MTWDPARPIKGGWYCSFYNEVMDNIPTTASTHAAGSYARLVPEPRTTISSTEDLLGRQPGWWISWVGLLGVGGCCTSGASDSPRGAR